MSIAQPIPITRREYLKIAGATTVVLTLPTGVVGASTERHGIRFDHVVDMVADAGCDPTGVEPCDAKLQAAADDDTLLVFPAGAYKLVEKNVIFDRVNLGFLGDGDVRFVVPENFNEKVLVVDRGTGLLFENIDIDLTAAGATPGLHLAADDDLQVHDVEFIGQGIHPDERPQPCGNKQIEGCHDNPTVTNAFYPIVRSPDGTGLVRNVVARNAGLMGAYTRTGVWIGISHEGTLRLENCRFEEFSGNGLYCSRTNGVVQVEGGEFRNNDVSQVRLGSRGSYVANATIEVDSTTTASPNPEDALNQRGVWFESGTMVGGGPEVRNCEITLASAPNSGGGVVTASSVGDFAVTDTRIQVDVDDAWGVFASRPDDGQAASVSTAALLRNVVITGKAAGSATAGYSTVLLVARPESVVENCCVYQTGEGRDGITLVDTADATIRDTNINVVGTPIVLTNSTAETSNVTEDGTCSVSVPRISETGTVSMNQPARNRWHAVSFREPFENPVVVAGPVSFNDGQPCHVRVRNVSGEGFECRLEEWAYLDGNHTNETIPYLAVEAGSHTLADGTRIEAGSARTTHRFTNVGFAEPFVSVPVVLAEAQTYNGSDPVVTRLQDVSTAGFDVRVQEEERKGSHTAETVGYVAIEPGTGVLDGAAFEARATPDAVTHRWYHVGFEGTYDTPAFLAGMQTFDGSDPAGLRYRNLSDSDVEVFIEEERSKDTETDHTTESVGYVVVDSAVVG